MKTPSIVLCGFMGCGKTTVGELAARILGMGYVDADQYIQQQAGLTISQMFERYGEEYFRDREHEAMLSLAREEGTIISSGGGALTFRRNVDAVRRSAFIAYIQADFPICYQRIAGDTSRPLVMSNTKESLETLYRQRDGLYRACADVVIPNNGAPLASAQALARWIGQRTAK